MTAPAVPVRLERVAPADHERDLLQYFYLCGLWCLTTYTACDLRCSYCVSYAQGRSEPRRGPDDVVEHLRAELDQLPADAVIGVGALIDCYPRAEADHGVTRLAVAELLERGHRLVIVTKGLAIRRDLDLLAGRGDQVSVLVSLSALDDDALRRIEPHVASATQRLELIDELAAAGVRVELHAQPWVPGVTEAEEMIDRMAGRVPVCFGPLNIQTPTMIGSDLARRWTQHEINQAYLAEHRRIGPRPGVVWQQPAWLEDVGPTRTGSGAQGNEATLRRLVAGFDQGSHPAIVLEVLSPHVVGHDRTGRLSDPAHPASGQFVDLVGAAATALGRPRFAVAALDADGDEVRSTIAIRGRLDRPLLGLEATGDPVTLEVDSTYRFDGNGLIVELWQHRVRVDGVELAPDEGAVPAGGCLVGAPVPPP